MAGDIYVAAVSGTIQLEDGTLVSLQEGITRVRSGHSLLKGREGMFRKLGVHYEVEQATARPGEKRATPAPKQAQPTEEKAPEPSSETAAEMQPEPVKRGPGRPRKNPPGA